MNQTEKDKDTRSEKKAKKFRLYKFIAISLLVAFLIIGLVVFENDITVENLRYMIKYLDFSSSGAFEEETEVHYNADAANRFYVFRGDLALVNETGVTLFDRRGSAVMTDRFNMSNPTCVAGEKYLAVYDLGGHQVRIYNSFSLLYEETFDYIIQSVSVNSAGDFSVVTSEKSYHSAVFVYDKDFHRIQEWFSADKFAYDAHLSDHNTLTIATVRSSSGALTGEVVQLKLGKKEPLFTYTGTDQMPLALSADRKGVTFVTDESLLYLVDGEEKNKAQFPEDGLQQVRIGEKVTAVVQNELSVGVNYRLRVFDREGKEVTSQIFSVQIRDVEIMGDAVFVLTHTNLYVIREGEKMKEYALDGDFSDLGVLSKNTVVLCSDTFAKIRILD